MPKHNPRYKSIGKKYFTVCRTTCIEWDHRDITSVWQNLITTQQTFWKQVRNHICFTRTRASCDRKLIRDPVSHYFVFAYNFSAWIFNIAKSSSFLYRPSRKEKEIVSDIPDPEEIGACGAMDFYQQNIWHKTALNINNLLLFPLTIRVRQ